MHKKQLYEAPDAELLVVKFEENILSYNPDNNEKPLDGGEEDF